MFPNSLIGNYIIDSKIGTGSYSSVYLGFHKDTLNKVAIKMVNKFNVATLESLTRFNREISILKQMNHPFIAELFEVLETETCFYLVMEYVENGTILEYVNLGGKLSEEVARRYFCQLISALDYLHNKMYIAHRDLKAENVLLDKNYNIRLIDFGLSNVFSTGSPSLYTACGSPAYAPPEMIKGEKYTKAADIWSLGILFYAMVAGKLPFDDVSVQNLLKKICVDEVSYPSYFSKSFIDFLNKLLTKNPENRITMTKIKEHPWFSRSEFYFLTEFNFLNFFNDQNSLIDYEIINDLNNLGFDTRNISEMLINNEFTEITAIYKLKKREKKNEKMKDLLNQMKSWTMNNPNNSLLPSNHFSPNSIIQRKLIQPTTKVFPKRNSKPIIKIISNKM